MIYAKVVETEGTRYEFRGKAETASGRVFLFTHHGYHKPKVSEAGIAFPKSKGRKPKIGVEICFVPGDNGNAKKWTRSTEMEKTRIEHNALL